MSGNLSGSFSTRVGAPPDGAAPPAPPVRGIRRSLRPRFPEGGALASRPNRADPASPRDGSDGDHRSGSGRTGLGRGLLRRPPLLALHIFQTIRPARAACQHRGFRPAGGLPFSLSGTLRPPRLPPPPAPRECRVAPAPSSLGGSRVGAGSGLTGFPWGLAGYSLAPCLPLIQVSALSGVYGVSFLVVSANVLGAASVRYSKGRPL